MKRMYFRKVLVALLIFSFTVIGMTTPAYAWKIKTHVYSANLILDEIQTNNGYVEIEPFGKFQVKPEYKDAIMTYPEYYRAGAMGFDVLPDIYVGQTVFHPGDVNYTSGQFVEVLWDKAKALPDNITAPENDPANGYIQLNNKKQAMAFILGFAGHAAGDFFGHSYINDKSGGEWPVITDGIDSGELSIITKHNVFEAYIDSKIPYGYQSAEKNTIQVPQRFIFDTMVSNGNTTDILGIPFSSRNLSSIYGLNEPMHFKVFYDIRNTLINKIIEINNNQNSSSRWDRILSTLTLEFAQKEYCYAWIDDIDAGLADWVAANGKVAQYMLEEGGMTKAKEEYIRWSRDNLMKMLGAPDVVSDISNAIGNVAAFAEGLIPDALTAPIEKLKSGIYNTIFEWAFGIKYDDLVKMWSNPELYLNQTALFGNNAKAILDNEMGNFDDCTNALDQTFVPFENTLVFMKCSLIGNEGLMELRRRAGSTSSWQPERNIDMVVKRVVSMDYGYNWDNSPEGEGILFGLDNYEDINKVAKVIFNFNGTTPRVRPTFSNVPQSFAIPVGLGHSPDEYNISVNYSGAPIHGNIGLYKENETARGSTFYSDLITATGNGSFSCIPDEPGRYQFRIYDTQDILLASSDVIVITKGESQPEQAGFDSIKTPLNPNEDVTFQVDYNDTNCRPGFIAVYRVSETNPLNMLENSKIILNASSNTTLLSVSAFVLTPDVPGNYEARAYGSNNVLLAKSNIFEVTSTAAGEAGAIGTAPPASNSAYTQPPAGYGKIALTLGNPIMWVNGVSVEIDPGKGTAPEIKDGRTCLPIRAVTEAMGGTVGWDGNQKKVTLKRGDSVVELWVGKKTAIANGVKQTLDVAPYTSKTGRTMIPLRFAGESLGGEISWDNTTKTAAILYRLLDSPLPADNNEPGSPTDSGSNDTGSGDSESATGEDTVSVVPHSIGAPVNVGVSPYIDDQEELCWFDVDFSADSSLNTFGKLAYDGHFDNMGYNSINLDAQIDYKYNESGSWQYDSSWDDPNVGNAPFEGITEALYSYSDGLPVSIDEMTPSITALDLSNKTVYFRVRFILSYYNENTGENSNIISPWSTIVAAGKNAAQTVVSSMESPTLSVQYVNEADNPHYAVNVKLPESVKALNNGIGSVIQLISYRRPGEDWSEESSTSAGLLCEEYEEIPESGETYEVRVRFGYSSVFAGEIEIYSSYSNIVTVGGK